MSTVPTTAATDSVVKGGIALSLSRVVGMGCGFLLFLLIAWRSREDAGMFRTAAAYLMISEFLPLLGMHRWLATEMAAQARRRRALLRLCLYLAAVVSGAMALVYAAIAQLHVYGPDISHALLLVASAVVGSGLQLCTNSALVGMGLTHRIGLLNLAETLTRSLLGIGLILMGKSVIAVIGVFVIARWLATAAALVIVLGHVQGTDARVDAPLRRAFLGQIPNLATGVLCTIVVRYSAMVMLPWLRDEAEAGTYAAPYQLYDLLMLVPSVFIFSSNFLFCEAALRSPAALRSATGQLVYLSSLYIFPFVMLALALAPAMITFLFKISFAPSVLPFRIMMLTAALATLDQALSQAMVTSGQYRQDVVSTLAGAVVVVVGTGLLCQPWGATGAALAFGAATLATVSVRLLLLRRLLSIRLLFLASRRQLLAAAVAGASTWLLAQWLLPHTLSRSALWLALVPPGMLINVLLLRALGALSPVRRERMRLFLTRRA